MKKHILYLFLCTALSSFAQDTTSTDKRTFQELVIRSVQARTITPVTFTDLNRREIQRLYYGADMPSLLQYTPGINAYSDNGTGVGYSYFRLRGMDQTRINTTINGIPVNDPENQGVFFNNFADLLSGAEQVQVQRGIGTSTNGTSAFGGSVNITTRNLSESPEASVIAGVGSFNTNRFSAGVQSGKLGNGWMFYSRVGRVATDGYRVSSGTEVKSYQFSVAHATAKSLLKFNFFGGNAQSKLSYLGIDKATFDANPRSNPFVNGESDAFNQYFNQVQYVRNLRKGQHLTASAYFVKGNAPRFQYLANWYTFDMLNMLSTPYYLSFLNDTLYPGNAMTSYRLDQRYYGGYLNYSIERSAWDLQTGIHVSNFESDHFMEVDWASLLPPGISGGHRVYFNTGYKSEASGFVKFNLHAGNRFNYFADVQVRHAGFKYRGKDMTFRPEMGKVQDMSWTFFNPRVGVQYFPLSKLTVYAMAGVAYREPTRFDYLQDDFTVRDIKQNEIKPEQVMDVEAGLKLKGPFEGKINAYWMQFSNQIVPTGALNAFGYPVTGNVGSSLRAGLEADLRLRVLNHYSVSWSGAISTNRINSFQQTMLSTATGSDSVITFKNTTLALSPKQIHQLGVHGHWLNRAIEASVFYRYVSMQYLDNTANDQLSIPSFQVLDMSIDITPKSWITKGMPSFNFRVNNILDTKYATSGSVGGWNTIDATGARGQYALYFPAATRAFFVTMRWMW